MRRDVFSTQSCQTFSRN